VQKSAPTLIVSCTDRKSLPSASGLKLRSIPSKTDIDEAVKIWVKRINAASEASGTLQLRDLYRGEYWSIARELEHQCQMFVMSAGLGMETMDSCGPGYAATFAKGSVDSVLNFSSDKPEFIRLKWWNGLLQEGLGKGNLISASSEIVLVAVSDSYQQALSGQLIELSKQGKLIFTISGSPQIASLKNIENISHMKVGQWLRMVLGGSTPSIGIRFAAKMIETGSYDSPERAGELLSTLFEVYKSESTGKLPVFNRKQLSDGEVKKWIESQIQKAWSGRSKSAFLRVFRESGYACEQKRFGDLFNEVIGK
jgi:hypothetical protein